MPRMKQSQCCLILTDLSYITAAQQNSTAQIDKSRTAVLRLVTIISDMQMS